MGVCVCCYSTAANGHAANGSHDTEDDHQHRYETDSIDGEQAGEQQLADEMQRIELHDVGRTGGGDGVNAPPHHLEVKFADQPEMHAYEDMPEPGPDPDPYDFHPHHLELQAGGGGGDDEAEHDDRQSLSPQSVSQQATPEHPSGPGGEFGIGSRKPARYTKQHTGLKNISFGVGAAVMPSGKMEFDQEENEGFGSVKINRPIGKSGTRHDDTESVYSNGSQQGGGAGGHFDLKFYHNKLW